MYVISEAQCIGGIHPQRRSKHINPSAALTTLQTTAQSALRLVQSEQHVNLNSEVQGQKMALPKL